MTNKQFVQRHIPYRELKKQGMFPKGTKHTDYDVITERVLSFFGYKTIAEYLYPIQHSANWDNGTFYDGSFHISTF